jgi:hypothetical protein
LPGSLAGAPTLTERRSRFSRLPAAAGRRVRPNNEYRTQAKEFPMNHAQSQTHSLAALFWASLEDEPALLIGAMTAIVDAGLVLLFAFATDVTDVQQTATYGFATALTTLIGAVLTRGRVSPVAKGRDQSRS